jgi:Aldo/keto reductase family
MTQSTSAVDRSGTFAIGGDLPVHRLGYGVMQLPGPGVWGPPRDHDEAIRVLRRVVELGVNLIDTADSYGPFVADHLIREALHPYPEGLVIATKVGFTRQGPSKWVPVGRPEYLRQQVELNLRHLGLERIDLLQLHRVDPKVPLEDQTASSPPCRVRARSGTSACPRCRSSTSRPRARSPRSSRCRTATTSPTAPRARSSTTASARTSRSSHGSR